MSTHNTVTDFSCVHLEELATETVVVTYSDDTRKRIAATKIQRAFRPRITENKKKQRAFRERIVANKIQRAFRARDTSVIHRQLLRIYHDKIQTLHQQLGAQPCPDWAICPIIQEPIQEPRLCLTDGRIYERDAIVRALQISKRSPMNNMPTTVADLKKYAQPILATPVPLGLGDLTRVYTLWKKHKQSGLSVKCSECGRTFPLRKYSTCEEWLRAMDEHHRAKH